MLKRRFRVTKWEAKQKGSLTQCIKCDTNASVGDKPLAESTEASLMRMVREKLEGEQAA